LYSACAVTLVALDTIIVLAYLLTLCDVSVRNCHTRVIFEVVGLTTLET